MKRSDALLLINKNSLIIEYTSNPIANYLMITECNKLCFFDVATEKKVYVADIVDDEVFTII